MELPIPQVCGLSMLRIRNYWNFFILLIVLQCNTPSPYVKTSGTKKHPLPPPSCKIDDTCLLKTIIIMFELYICTFSYKLSQYELVPFLFVI